MPKPRYNLDFIGKNIRRHRKNRSLKIKELARIAGVTESHLGRIERGLNVPSSGFVYEIARILEVPVAALFRETGRMEYEIVHYRGEKRFSRALQKRVRRVIALYSQLEDLCRAGKYRSFPLDIPLGDFTRKEIEEASELCRELLGIRYAVVFDLFTLLENNGLRVVVMDLPARTSGFSFCESPSGTITFFINGRITVERRIYTLAHELGHVIFHQGSFKHGRDILSTPANPGSSVNFEQAANLFAACFLMPEVIIRKTVSQTGITPSGWNFDILTRIKTRFGVSAEAFLNRLRDLELIEPARARAIQKRIAAHYRKTRFLEPGTGRFEPAPNGRLWDLALIARSRTPRSPRVSGFERELATLGVLR
jgi:Zn-dependent peptidase ImmA (M78 family)/transcriptional regulator with XRE-family HTH domain